MVDDECASDICLQRFDGVSEKHRAGPYRKGAILFRVKHFIRICEIREHMNTSLERLLSSNGSPLSMNVVAWARPMIFLPSNQVAFLRESLSTLEN